MVRAREEALTYASVGLEVRGRRFGWRGRVKNNS